MPRQSFGQLCLGAGQVFEQHGVAELDQHVTDLHDSALAYRDLFHHARHFRCHERAVDGLNRTGQMDRSLDLGTPRGGCTDRRGSKALRPDGGGAQRRKNQRTHRQYEGFPSLHDRISYGSVSLYGVVPLGFEASRTSVRIESTCLDRRRGRATRLVSALSLQKEHHSLESMSSEVCIVEVHLTTTTRRIVRRNGVKTSTTGHSRRGSRSE